VFAGKVDLVEGLVRAQPFERRVAECAAAEFAVLDIADEQWLSPVGIADDRTRRRGGKRADGAFEFEKLLTQFTALSGGKTGANVSDVDHFSLIIVGAEDQ